MDHTWYAANSSTHQGLVVNEKSGDNIAVVYDKTNTNLIAAAPDMLEALERAESEADPLAHWFRSGLIGRAGFAAYQDQAQPGQ